MGSKDQHPLILLKCVGEMRQPVYPKVPIKIAFVQSPEPGYFKRHLPEILEYPSGKESNFTWGFFMPIRMDHIVERYLPMPPIG
jgi:hypothetical protein